VSVFLAITGLSLVHASSPIEVLRKSNERIHSFSLENGLRAFIKADPSAPVVAVQIWVGVGSIHEEEWMGAGLSHYVEHMIFKGTPTRTTGQISRDIDDAGGSVNAYTSLDRTVFHAVMPARNWRVGFDVLADAVMHAHFPEDEWEREQEVILREMAMGRDDPGRVLQKLTWGTAYHVHPYRHPVIGYEEVFIKTDRAMLLEFFRRNYTPDNMMIVIAGNVDHQEVESAIRETFTSFSRRMREPIVIPREPPQLAPRIARHTGPYEVTRINVVYHTVPLNHPDAPALDVLAAVVGSGDSSRLTLEIRDRYALAHSVNAWSYTPGEPGLFGISATLDPDRETYVLNAIQRETEIWATFSFSDADLEKAKRNVIVSALAALQTARGQANSIGSGAYYAGNPRFSEQYIASIETINRKTLNEVAARYLQPQNRTVAVLAPRDEDTEAQSDDSPPTLVHSPVKEVLPNGIPLIIREDHRLPFVYVTAAFLGGLLSETDDTRGLTRFTADLWTRGTKNKSAQEIAEFIESRGGSMNAFSGQNSFGLQAMCLVEDAPDFLELMDEIIRDAVFPREEINRQRALQLADIRARKERPFAIADDIMREALYGAHPYRWTISGEEETVTNFTSTDALDYLKMHCTTGNMAISMFGAISREQAKEWASQYFDRIPEGPRQKYSHVVPTRKKPIRITQESPHAQTIYLMGFPGMDVQDRDLPTLQIIQSSMSGLSSELGMEVREKRGLVYFVGALQRSGLDPGLFAFYAGTRADAVEELEELIENEIHRLVEHGLSNEELLRAQEQLVGSYYESLQDNTGLAQLAALNELYGLGYDHVFDTEKRLRAVTNEDVKRVAARILNNHDRIIVIVSPDAAENMEDIQ